MTTPGDGSFERLLEFVRESRGIDFTRYKAATSARRVAKRMAAVGASTYDEYMDFLELHPGEYGLLFDAMLINVTRFFRDPDAWDVLRSQVLPAIAAARVGDEPVRVWSAGCATGEEAYSLLMLLAEVFGEDAALGRVKVYATDVDEDALAHARAGVYTARQLDGVPAELRERFFEPSGARWAFRPDLRRCVIFGRHDLLADAPISRLDLLCCRNTLMYLNADAQAGVLSRFSYALRPEGFLFLGRAEMLLSYGRLFVPFDLKARVFRKAGAAIGVAPAAGPVAAERPVAGGAVSARRALWDHAFDASPVAQLVVGVDGTVVAVNDRARAMFGVNPRDVGRPLQDLEVSYRPLELRSRIEQAYSERRLVVARNVERPFTDGQPQYLDVTVMPLPADGAYLGVSVTYEDVTRYARLQAELKRSREELETAYEELQSANEELETSNEELQSANQELETSNEELQSANDELETMNEELQASNDELEAANEQERAWNAEATRAAAFLGGVLASVPSAVVAVSGSGAVTLWNASAEALWGLRAEEAVGRRLVELDFGLLPSPELEAAVGELLAGRVGERRLAVRAVDRRGTTVDVAVQCATLAVPDEPPGALVVMQAKPVAGAAGGR